MTPSTEIRVEDHPRALQALASADFDWCVRLRDVWIDNDNDVPDLHAVLREQFITQLASLHQNRGKSPLGWPIVGSGGTGKTHLLGCFRKMTIERDAAFVLVDMTDVNDFWHTALQGYLDSLQELVFDQTTQQDVILRRFLKLICPKEALEESLPKLTRTAPHILKKNIGLILGYLNKKYPQDTLKNQDVIRAVCCLNSENFEVQSIGLAWLQGQTLEDSTQREFGFTRPRLSARDIVFSLSWYMSLTGPTVVAFDQLDPIVHQISLVGLAPEDDPQRIKAKAIVQQIGTGFAAIPEMYWTFPIISCVESTWELMKTNVLHTAIQRFGPHHRLLSASSERFVSTLVGKRLQKAHKATGFTAPHTTWPFLPSALAELSNDPPRGILRKCDEFRRAMLAEGRVREVHSFVGEQKKFDPSEPDSLSKSLKELDVRFEHLKQQGDVARLLDETKEDKALAPLFVAALKCLTIEHRDSIPGNVDTIVEQDFPGAANSRPLHARLRLVFHDENGREEHYCVRGIEWANARAYQNRLTAAITQSGIDRKLQFRRLTIARTSPSPGGDKTAEINQNFVNAGGQFHKASETELRTLSALSHLLSENDTLLDTWLQNRKPVSTLKELVNRLVRGSLFVEVKPVSGTEGTSRTTAGESRMDDAKAAAVQPSEPPALSEPSTLSKAEGPAQPDDSLILPPAVNTKALLLPLGTRVQSFGDPELIQIPAGVLAKHTIIMGGAGSGKTVTVRRIVEEAALAGIPSIVIDCAQDMSTFDEARKSVDPHWRAGDAERAKRFAAATDFVVYTPGKSAGRPLTLEPIPDLTPLREDADELESAVAMVHGALASVVASGRSQRAQSKLGILTNTLTFFAKHVSKTSLPALIELLNELPEQALLGIANERKLAREMADALRIELVGNPLLKGSGTPLDPAILFGDDKPNGRTRISSISLVGLPSLEQQRSFINQLAMLLFAWIKKNPHPPAGRALRGLLVIDEAKDFIPAIKASSCKESMMRLAAQARKYKLGLVLATQHPKDIDTKIVGNCATQFYGRMVSPASLATATDLLNNLGATSANLSKLKTGQFYVNFPDGGLKSPALIQMPNSLTAERLLEEHDIIAKSNC